MPRRNRVPDFAAEDALVQVGTYVAMWRKIQQLTQAQVADRADVSRGVVQRIEAGAPGVTVDGLFRVLGALHITDEIVRAFDPLTSTVGQAVVEENLPSRVRRH